jgi:hypothetical protein
MLKYLLFLTVSLVTLSFADITKAESIYWINDGKKIQRANLDGTNVMNTATTQRVDPLDSISHLVVNRSFIYWAKALSFGTGASIIRAALDGSNVIELAFLKKGPDRWDHTYSNNGLLTGARLIPGYVYIDDMEATDTFIY